MKKNLLLSLLTLGLALPVFAQDAGAAATNWPLFGAAIGLAIAAAGCGLGQGRATAAACESLARNPGAAGNIRTALILGLALIESLVLYALLVVFLSR
jgi:F-type H+-transporting ATPase subunit c